jgi:hypothetical protein
MSLLVPLAFGGIAAALWRRSIGWTLAVVNAALLFTLGWSYWLDDGGPGADMLLRTALLGLVVVDVALLAAARRLRRRSSRTTAAAGDALA